MRVTEPVDAGSEATVKAFVDHLRALDIVSDAAWYNEEYLQRKITVALLKRALQHMRVPLGGATSKVDIGKLITTNLDKTQTTEEDEDKDIALSILNRWFMAPIKGEATKGLREGLQNEAEVLRLLKEFFVRAERSSLQVKTRFGS